METKKKRMYDIFSNYLGQLYKIKTRIIPWAMAWDGIVIKTRKCYLKELGISNSIEAYMQYLVIGKMIESISLEHKLGEERDQEFKVKSERELSNKEEVNQDTPGKAETTK